MHCYIIEIEIISDIVINNSFIRYYLGITSQLNLIDFIWHQMK